MGNLLSVVCTAVVQKKKMRNFRTYFRQMRGAFRALLNPYRWVSCFRYICRQLLTYVYLRSSLLQSIFSFHICYAGRNSEFPEDYDELPISRLGIACGVNITPHYTLTSDGYYICLQRLCPSVSSLRDVPNDGKTVDNLSARDSSLPVLIIHGLMQDSESFLCSGRTSSLASVLAHAGYDVWLGNNRGTKYSLQHSYHRVDSDEFWDFSIEDLARWDIPAMVQYILSTTKKSKLAIIGFSQGSAQTILSLSLHPELCSQIALFIALSPPVKVKGTGITHPMIAGLLHRNELLFRGVFGQQAMLRCVETWQQLLSRKFFSTVCSSAMYILFGWRCNNISADRRHHLFQHIYSHSSVKCVTHWFQIMATQSLGAFRRMETTFVERFLEMATFLPKFGAKQLLQLFRPSVSVKRRQRKISKKLQENNGKSDFIEPHHLALSRISCPVASLLGERDGLIDSEVVLGDLVPNCILHHVEPTYEHLDMIWADCAPVKIFPIVLSLLSFIQDHSAGISSEQENLVNEDNGDDSAAEI